MNKACSLFATAKLNQHNNSPQNVSLRQTILQGFNDICWIWLVEK